MPKFINYWRKHIRTFFMNGPIVFDDLWLASSMNYWIMNCLWPFEECNLQGHRWAATLHVLKVFLRNFSWSIIAIARIFSIIIIIYIIPCRQIFNDPCALADLIMPLSFSFYKCFFFQFRFYDFNLNIFFFKISYWICKGKIIFSQRFFNEFWQK